MRPLAEQTILVTGSSDGHGKAVAADLATRGASVIAHGRDPQKTEAAGREIGATRTLVADLASLAEVRALAAEVGPLDALVNNAGVWLNERGVSPDGHELSFAINHLSHFLLTALLLPGLREPARIVNVASIGQAPLDFGDIEFERGYDGFSAYGRSKLAQVLFTRELAERLGERPITVNALHPATLMDTGMVRNSRARVLSSVEEGMEATVRLVADPDLDGVSGRFFDGRNESPANAQVDDAAARRRLWELSEELTGERMPV